MEESVLFVAKAVGLGSAAEPRGCPWPDHGDFSGLPRTPQHTSAPVLQSSFKRGFTVGQPCAFLAPASCSLLRQASPQQREPSVPGLDPGAGHHGATHSDGLFSEHSEDSLGGGREQAMQASWKALVEVTARFKRSLT